MEHFVSPIILYIACGLGALGVLTALPKPKFSPFVIGAIIGGAAFGLLMVALGLKAGKDNLPNFHFYIFSALALGSALRVITHPRPIYSALYFILTILASAGLYLILSAEFMTFALVIVYAGAILITYLFVIMLATEGPSEAAVEQLTEFDRQAREPVMATFAGFLLLAGLTSILMTGTRSLTVNASEVANGRELSVMGAKVERILREARVERSDSSGVIIKDTVLRDGESLAKMTVNGEERWAVDVDKGVITVVNAAGTKREILRKDWPADLKLSNTEGVGMTLIEKHPLSIEIAGVILLMAMLGAVVLARKKVEMDERAKLDAAAREHSLERAGDMLGLQGPFAQPGVGGDR